jgi:hypothetical protein
MSIRDTDYKPQENVSLRSPLAIGGFFIHYLRTRFNEAYSPPWVWREDDTLTDLFVVAGSTIENEIRNNRPAVYVNVGPLREGSMVIGNNFQTEWLQDKKFSYSRIDMSVTVNCESSNRGECHLLGWSVFTALIAAQDVLRTKYRIANIGPFELIPPRPSKLDRETFISTVTIALSYELTWNVTAVQTAIKEIDLRLDMQGMSDPSGYLTQIYVSSIKDTKNPETDTTLR